MVRDDGMAIDARWAHMFIRLACLEGRPRLIRIRVIRVNPRYPRLIRVYPGLIRFNPIN